MREERDFGRVVRRKRGERCFVVRRSLSFNSFSARACSTTPAVLPPRPPALSRPSLPLPRGCHSPRSFLPPVPRFRLTHHSPRTRRATGEPHSRALRSVLQA